MFKQTLILITFIFLSVNCYAQNASWVIYNTSNSGLPENSVRSIAIEDNGTKWIGTWGGGLAKFDGTNWTVYNTSNSGLSDNFVSTIAIDINGDKWIGTWDGGLAKFDDNEWTIYLASNSGLNANRIIYISIASNGDKWIGHSGGLAKFDGTNWVLYNEFNSSLPIDWVNAVLIEPNGDKWIGTGWGGLAKFTGTNWNVFNQSNSDLPHNVIQTIAIDANRAKWIGTLSGLAKLNGNNWTIYNNLNSGLPNNDVRSIVVDGNGVKWIGNYLGGFSRFDGTNWTVYNQSNSDLPDNRVRAVAISRNNEIYIGTHSGLAIFSEEVDVDIGIESVLELSANICGSENQKIEIVLKNHGKKSVTDFKLTAKISGDIEYEFSSVFKDTLYSGESSEFKIGTFNSTKGGDIEIKVFISKSDDANNSNDTIRTKLHILPLPAYPDVQDAFICQGSYATLTGLNTDNNSKWYLSPTSTESVVTGSTYITGILDTNSIVYVKNFSDEGCFTKRKAVNVNIRALPDAGFKYIKSMGTANFTPNDTTYISYQWDFGDGHSSNEISPQYFYETDSLYIVSLKVEDVNGCTDSSMQTVAEERLFVPSAFAPEGENQYFEVFAFQINKFEIIILNSWGEILFRSDDTGFKWDGNYKGELLNEGIYYYSIIARGPSGKRWHAKGTIFLMR